MTGESRSRPHSLAAAAVCAPSGLSPLVWPEPHPRECIPPPNARGTALIERGPAIGQVYVSGTAFAVDRRRDCASRSTSSEPRPSSTALTSRSTPPAMCSRHRHLAAEQPVGPIGEVRPPHRRRHPRHRRGLVRGGGADERAASARRLRQRRADRLFDPGPRRRFAQHGAAETAGAAPGRRRALPARVRHRADVEAQPRLSRPHHARGDADRLLSSARRSASASPSSSSPCIGWSDR